VTLVDTSYLVTVMPETIDRPVLLVGSGRCGSTLLQSVLNTNPDFLIWGEHNGFLRQIAAAYYDAAHQRFPDQSGMNGGERIKKLRDSRRWPAWDNLCGAEEFREQFRGFIRSFFADPTGRAGRWGFKEIRYGQTADDRTLQLMFDCFSETRLVILVREPEGTIFSVLSHWAFADQRQGMFLSRN
jgi:Sulfotransferase family